MSTAVSLGNIIGVTQNIFLKAVIPLKRNLDTNTTFSFCLEVADFVNAVFAPVKKIDEGVQATVVAIGLVLPGALIRQNDAHPAVEKGELPEPLTQDIKMELYIGKGLCRWLKPYGCTRGICFSDNR